MAGNRGGGEDDEAGALVDEGCAQERVCDGVGSRWAAGVMATLQGLVSETVEALAEIAIKPDDLIGVDRRAKAIAGLARAVKAVEALRARPRLSSVSQSEDAMSEDESDEIDAAELDRIRGELESRLDSLRATIEAKRMARAVVAGADAAGAEDDAGSA